MRTASSPASVAPDAATSALADAARRRDERALDLHFWPVQSADGTVLRAWSNGAEGPTVLLCNGLGTGPHAWPALLQPDCGVRVVSWFHRGVGGSDRPADPARVGIQTIVEDAVAVLDHLDVDRCVVMGWSMGVNTAFELATLHPDRVRGLLAVAGVPGATFSSMLAPLFVPRPLRRPITGGVSRFLSRTGWVLTPVVRRIRVGPTTTSLLRHSGFMLPAARPEDVHDTLRDFLTTPVDWYMHLAHELVPHGRVSLSRIRHIPAYFVAGRWDVLASHKDMRTAAERFDDSRYIVLNGSHFLPLEHSDQIHDILLELLERVGSTQ